MPLHDLTALQVAAAVRSGELGVVEIVEHSLNRIEQLDGELGAFVTVTADAALDQARRADALIMGTEDRSTLPPLLGVPTAIKDLNLTKGVPTRFGSRLFKDFVPDVDDYVVELLRTAGTISLGKTATPEFGLPCYTETDIGPPARTPWDTGRLAGGSSGGAGAAVAAGFVPFAQGSDGGGSIRIPASVCGLVGLKTSRGRVSRGPLDADATRLSVLGPLARTVRDAAVMLDAMAVGQSGDVDPAPGLPAGETFLRWCDREPGRLRIGRFIESPIEADIDPQVRAAWEDASRLLEQLGHEVIDIPMLLPRDAVPAFEAVWAVSAWGAPVDPSRATELRPLTRYLRARGAAVSGPRFAEAIGLMSQLSRQALAATAHLDALLSPTLALLPVPIGWFDSDGDPAADFERQKRFTPYTSIFNVTGQPAISLPLYQSAEGLPIGIMLAGRPRGEAALLSLAAQVEAALPWANRHPPMWRL